MIKVKEIDRLLPTKKYSKEEIDSEMHLSKREPFTPNAQLRVTRAIAMMMYNKQYPKG